MKKLFNIYSIFALVGMLFLISCEDTDLIRYPNIEKTIAMKLDLDPAFTLFDALDINNAKLKFSLYGQGEIDSVNFFVNYFNFDQDSTYDKVALVTLRGSDFPADGFIPAYEITSQAVATALGIDVNTIGGGDRMDFEIVTVDMSGISYPDTEPTIPGTTFSNVTPGDLISLTTSISTAFTAFVACPVDPSYAVGTYKMEQISGAQDPFFGTGNVLATLDEVTITAPDLLTRRFSPVSYATFVGGRFNFLLVCNSIITPYTGAPASCGGGLGWTLDATKIPTYDDADDSEFIIDLLHNPTGDCGLPTEPMQIKLTKIQ